MPGQAARGAATEMDLPELDFLTPLGALAALTVAAPLAALVAAGRRGERARVAIGLPASIGRTLTPVAAALLLVGGLVGTAAAQPVLRSRDEVSVRTDAALWVVIDTSRSMLASTSRQGRRRIERARQLALQVRAALPNVPVGVASLSDRVLPHLFPSSDPAAFGRTVETTIRAGNPSPIAGGRLGTDLTAIAAVPRLGFFESAHRRRALLVLTDGESAAVAASTLTAAFRGSQRTALVVVHIGAVGEKVYDHHGLPEPAYRPIANAATMVQQIAATAGGRSLAEADAAAAPGVLRSALGARGPTAERRHDQGRRPLAAYVLAAAALPLGWLLRRRNLG
jgi:hypothetical protein